MMNSTRRRVLRGMMGGGAVTVGLPLLNCFLNGNGTALASGQPMPLRFGTWTWGLGISRAVFVPKQAGANYELPEEIECLKPVQKHINVLTDYSVFRDSYQNFCHYTGWVTMRSGSAPADKEDKPGETFDVTIANKIGKTTRFKMLTATATGDTRATLSYNSRNSINSAEFSPIKFYTRLFGPDFQDPNAPTFTPNPRTMVRKSVLSGDIMDDIKDLERHVGAEDKARLEQHFTGLRALEHQLDQQLTKPEPIPSCHAPKAVKQEPMPGVETSVLAMRHNLMADLMLNALVCDQTRVFNLFYAAATAVTIKKGYDKPHHTCTHEEPIDDKLGYQPVVSWFTRRAMESWLYFVQAVANIKEGDGTLLDNMLILAHSEQGLARIHALDGWGLFTAGRAGGKVKTGLHIPANGAPATQLSLTAMRVMGIDMQQWGTRSNNTSKSISELLV